MTIELLDQARAFRAGLAGFDPAVVSGPDCRVLAEELAAVAKACAAASARAGARAAVCGAHLGAGFSDPAEWLARASGSSTRSAQAALDTAVTVDSCPETAEALRAGELSIDQADEIARTEAARPGSEAELLALAPTTTLMGLRDQARRRRLEVLDPDELHARQHRARSLRTWRDGMGMVCLSGALPPEVGVPLVNRLDVECDRIRRAARREGNVEARAAHAADARVALTAGSGAGRSPRAELVVVCDLGAYRRGQARPGEVCHIVGGGPVPVSVARELGRDALVKAVVHDGVKIDTVVHYGRHLG